MITYIRGLLVEKEPTRVVVEAAGVGYEILIPLSTYDRLPKTGEESKVLIYHCVREDDEILFGFATTAERDLFMKLTGVSGVGPKTALSILSGTTAGDLALAISTGDAKRIAAIKGVGKKTAEKICIELADKINAVEALASSQRGYAGKDAVLALAALGFAQDVAGKMVSDVIAKRPDITDTETLIRLALSGSKK